MQRCQFFSWTYLSLVSALFWLMVHRFLEQCILCLTKWKYSQHGRRAIHSFLEGGRKQENPEETQTKDRCAKQCADCKLSSGSNQRPSHYIEGQKYIPEWPLLLSIHGADLLTPRLSNERLGKDRLSCVLPHGPCLIVFSFQQTVEGCLGCTSTVDLIKTT